MNAVVLRVAHAEPRWGLVVPREPGSDPVQRWQGVPGYLVVLADDAGHRALPVRVWRRNPGAVPIHDLLDRPADDIWTTAPVPEELSVRLAAAAGGRVTGVEIYPVMADPEEVTAETFAARIDLGASHVTARLDQGLRMAVVAGAPVRVDAAVMDRLAVPVPGDDPAAPFHPPPVAQARATLSHREGRVLDVAVERVGERPRFEPRNMAFADGLDRWLPYTAVPGEYFAAAEDSCATLSSAVPEAAGSAALLQTVFADDFRGATVVFRGEYRTENVAGSAGLCLRILWRGKEPGREQQRVATAGGNTDWSTDEISTLIPEDADMIQFGVILTGTGQVWLRNPELRRGNA